MNRDKAVDEWLEAYDNPMKPVVEAVREAVLSADPRIGECIKWQAPTFTYKGNIASFFPKAKKHATLMFHKGASIPGDFPNLMGDARDGRSMNFSSLDDLAGKKAELQAVCVGWCELMDKARK
ncbi:MAG: DUF1801 domain-containing protein [Hyphomicrobiaceae bacterium]|nr:DUF1801 domain-containing protein [Hyphomicrobiaceae bacterium]MCC0023211.1 DUF1801 domain-containing protein [Hyphomicrobiaceae bacterium]